LTSNFSQFTKQTHTMPFCSFLFLTCVAPTAPMQQQTQAAIDPITPVDNGGFDDDIPF
jgi:hypothetical protein